MRYLATCVFLAATVSAAPIQWAGNGHWYEVSTASANFAAARSAASASTFMGMQGYLATITSAAENLFVSQLTNFQIWLGGSDAETEGVWKWLDGPEAGMVFGYTAWNLGTGEPNNVGNEDGVLLNQFLPTRTWNDAPLGSTLRYVVEYSPSQVVPEPSTAALVVLAAGALVALKRKSA